MDVQYRLWGKTVTEYPWLGIADAEWADTGTSGVAISIADDNGPMRMTGVSSISNNTGITVGYNFKKSFWSTYGSEWDNGIINHEAGAKVLQSGENSLEIAVDFVNAMGKITVTNKAGGELGGKVGIELKGGLNAEIGGKLSHERTVQYEGEGWKSNCRVLFLITRTGPGQFIVRPQPTKTVSGNGISNSPGTCLDLVRAQLIAFAFPQHSTNSRRLGVGNSRI